MDGKTPEEIEAEMMCADGTCAVSGRAEGQQPPAPANQSSNGSSGRPACHDGSCYDATAREDAAREELYDVSSGRPIYHLCQREKWLQAVRSKQPYVPPTFWSDGRFTRGSCVLDSLVGTANTYYKGIEGEWLVLEMNPSIVHQMGTMIAVHRAPESTADEPIQCLKIHGGIPTAIPGLVAKIYRMQRNDEDGTFTGMVQTGDIVPRVATSTILQTAPLPALVSTKDTIMPKEKSSDLRNKTVTTKEATGEQPAAVGMKGGRTWFLRGKFRKGKQNEGARN